MLFRSGAGVILSNVKLDHGEITIPTPGGMIPTGLKKFGAIIGDHAEIGCHTTTNPGSIIGRNTVVYPGTIWRGFAPSDSIVKTTQTHTVVSRRD